MVNIPLKYAVVTVSVFISLFLAYGAHTYRFFSNELRHQGISESVRVGNRTYAVSNGAVFSEDVRVRGLTALRALRVAYGKALAGRSPLLGLEGTDPEALRANTTLLKKTMDEFSLLQETDEDAALVKNALYPVDFLYALSSLESARKQFIASGSEPDLRLYMDSFDPVFTSGIQDAKKLLDAFVYETSSGTLPQTVNFAGTLSATSTIASLASIPDALARIKKQTEKRSLCLSGITLLCPQLSLSAIEVESTQSLEESAPNIRHTVETQIASIFRSVTRMSVYDASYAPVRLERSVCLASFPPPYNFETSIRLHINFDLLHYLDDMYFIPTAGDSGPVPEFLRDGYGLDYLKMNPMAFYLCPHLIEDVSIAQATLQTVALANNYSDIPNAYRDVLLSGVPDSKNASAYIREAADRIQRESLPAGYVREVLSVSLMFTQKSAALDAVVAHIVDISTHDLTMVQKGIPLDLSAKNLFYTHTAAPSLFLFHQIGALSPLTSNATNGSRNLNKKIESYSNLREDISHNELVRQIRIMKHIEQGDL